jgi:hypothetical protein
VSDGIEFIDMALKGRRSLETVLVELKAKQNRSQSPSLARMIEGALRPDDARLGSSPSLRAQYQPLEFMDGMNHLRPEIPGRVVVLVDTLV